MFVDVGADGGRCDGEVEEGALKSHARGCGAGDVAGCVSLLTGAATRWRPTCAKRGDQYHCHCSSHRVGRYAW
jgi:hypothetical protein